LKTNVGKVEGNNPEKQRGNLYLSTFWHFSVQNLRT